MNKIKNNKNTLMSKLKNKNKWKQLILLKTTVKSNNNLRKKNKGNFLFQPLMLTGYKINFQNIMILLKFLKYKSKSCKS